MKLGFSYVGLVYLVMLMLPNIIWTKNQPKDYEKYVGNENKVLLMFERIGGWIRRPERFAKCQRVNPQGFLRRITTGFLLIYGNKSFTE